MPSSRAHHTTFGEVGGIKARVSVPKNAFSKGASVLEAPLFNHSFFFDSTEILSRQMTVVVRVPTTCPYLPRSSFPTSRYPWYPWYPFR